MPTPYNSQTHSLDISEQHRPKFPTITSKKVEAEKFICQVFNTVINEHNYILPKTQNMNDDAIQNNIGNTTIYHYCH